jgi:hypothetical protein
MKQPNPYDGMTNTQKAIKRHNLKQAKKFIKEFRRLYQEEWAYWSSGLVMRGDQVDF